MCKIRKSKKKTIWLVLLLLIIFVGLIYSGSNRKDKADFEDSTAQSSSDVTASEEAFDEELVDKSDINSSSTEADVTAAKEDSDTGNINEKVNDKFNDENKATEPVDITLGSFFEVHFIDVGQGDSSLIICDNEAMLIDAGNNNMGTRVQKYLRDQGITELKYVIGSHSDADHIGGLDVIIYKFTCENILMPDAVSDTKSYEEIIAAVGSKGYKITNVGEGDIFTLGSARFEILSPVKGYPYSENNNNSVILRLDYYNTSFLFMGDAEYQPQQVIIYDDELNAKADVVKVSHHGANSGYLKAFYDEVEPKYAIISVGKGNDYSHPHEEVLKDFKNRGVQVYRTDEQGTIVAKSDGNNIFFGKDPSDTWAVGEVHEINGTANENPVEGITYVLNTNSMRFHYPTCDSVKDMKQKNRVDLTCTRETLLSQYPDAVPCKRCNP